MTVQISLAVTELPQQGSVSVRILSHLPSGLAKPFHVWSWAVILVRGAARKELEPLERSSAPEAPEIGVIPSALWFGCLSCHTFQDCWAWTGMCSPSELGMAPHVPVAQFNTQTHCFCCSSDSRLSSACWAGDPGSSDLGSAFP